MSSGSAPSEAASGGQPEGKPRTWLPMALWSAGIVLALGLAWLGSEAYALHWAEKVLIAEFAPRPGSLWFPDFDGAAKKLGGPERTLRLLRRYLALKRPYRNEGGPSGPQLPPPSLN